MDKMCYLGYRFYNNRYNIESRSIYVLNTTNSKKLPYKEWMYMNVRNNLTVPRDVINTELNANIFKGKELKEIAVFTYISNTYLQYILSFRLLNRDISCINNSNGANFSVVTDRL